MSQSTVDNGGVSDPPPAPTPPLPHPPQNKEKIGHPQKKKNWTPPQKNVGPSLKIVWDPPPFL